MHISHHRHTVLYSIANKCKCNVDNASNFAAISVRLAFFLDFLRASQFILL